METLKNMRGKRGVSKKAVAEHLGKHILAMKKSKKR